MSKPRIALPLPTSFDPDYNHRCWPQYARAIAEAGGIAVAIELTGSPSEIAQQANSCSGVLLPGSPADVTPQKYSQDHEPATSPADARRESADELLLQDAHNLHKPLLTICYGTQSLNVWRGGTLLQDLTVVPVNHKAGPGVAIAHTVAIVRRTILDSLSTEITQDRLPVNSSHHQAIGIVGDGLRVVARCPQDGVVEAVEGNSSDGHFVVGVQWHPERILDISEFSRWLFARFVRECADWSPRRVVTSVG